MSQKMKMFKELRSCCKGFKSRWTVELYRRAFSVVSGLRLYQCSG